MTKKTYIIIGTSAAGIGAAYRLRMLDAQARIICISQEYEIPYNKCFIAEYLSGERAESQIITLSPEVATQKNIECMLGTCVTSIEPESQKVFLSNGFSIEYDCLLIATGCSPIVPSCIAGSAIKDGIFTFYNAHDVNAIHAHIKTKKPRNVVVIGAGLSGLEAADSLRAHGINVSVIEKASHVLSQQITQDAATVIHAYMQACEVALYCNTSVTRIMHEDGMCTGVQLSDGSILQADIVICAVGVKPNSELAMDVGLHVDNGYIVVDAYMQTNMADIYAAGDVVLVKDQVTGAMVPSCTWPDAMQQGMIAAYNMVGQQKTYAGVLMTASSAFFGVKYMVCGWVKNIPDTYRIESKKGDGWYHVFVYNEHNQLKGFILVGNTQEGAHFKRSLVIACD